MSKMQVPGRAGFSLLGDESIEFYRTPREYMEKRRRTYGEVFLGRIINKRTVFMTSNRSVQGLLHGKLTVFTVMYSDNHTGVHVIRIRYTVSSKSTCSC